MNITALPENPKLDLEVELLEEEGKGEERYRRWGGRTERTRPL